MGHEFTAWQIGSGNLRRGQNYVEIYAFKAANCGSAQII